MDRVWSKNHVWQQQGQQRGALRAGQRAADGGGGAALGGWWHVALVHDAQEVLFVTRGGRGGFKKIFVL